MLTTKSHRDIDANSPMLRQGIVPDAKRGHYEEGGEGKSRRARRVVEEDGMRVRGVERDASPATSGASTKVLKILILRRDHPWKLIMLLLENIMKSGMLKSNICPKGGLLLLN